MRATSNKIMDDGPEEIEALLPWYAAGTLDAHDARRVEDALKHDAALQKQYAVIREEFAETVALNEELGAPSSRALQKLMVAIDAEPAGAASPAASQGLGRFARFFASLSPRTVAWSASFGALALVLQAGLIGTILMRSGLEAFQSPAYQQHTEQTSPERPAPATTAAPSAQDRRTETSVDLASRERAIRSTPAPVQQEPALPRSLQTDQARPNNSLAAAPPPQQQAAKRSVIPAKEVVAAVTFRPDARMSEILALLGSYRASVIGSDGGVLRLQFEGMTTAPDLNVILAALRKERIVAEAAAAP
jgi:hypothetical protein